MKKFTVQCNFDSQINPVQIYIGEPSKGFHPLQFQSVWLAEEKGGIIPAEVMGSFQKLINIAKENGVDFEELCMYALGTNNDVKNTDQSNPVPSQGPPENVIASDKIVQKKCKILANEKHLSELFNSQFNLLFVSMLNKSGSVEYCVLLTPLENTENIKQRIQNNEITIEQLRAFGQIEVIGKGENMDESTKTRIFTKYKIDF